MARYVTIPSGKSVPLGAYVAAWKRVKATDPETEITGWDWFPMSARRILADMRHGMNDRISAGISYASRGVK